MFVFGKSACNGMHACVRMHTVPLERVVFHNQISINHCYEYFHLRRSKTSPECFNLLLP